MHLNSGRQKPVNWSTGVMFNSGVSDAAVAASGGQAEKHAACHGGFTPVFRGCITQRKRLFDYPVARRCVQGVEGL